MKKLLSLYLIIFSFITYGSGESFQSESFFVTPLADSLVNEDQYFEYDFSSNLTEGEFTYQLYLPDSTDLPSWLQYHPLENTLWGTPSEDQIGTYELILFVASTPETYESDTFLLEVQEINDIPELVKMFQNAALDVGFGSVVYNLGDYFTDEETESLDYDFEISGSSVTGSLTGSQLKLFEATKGNSQLLISASDGENEIEVGFSVLVLDISTSEAFGYKTTNTGSNGLINSYVRAVYPMENQLWVGTKDGLSHYNKATGVWSSFLGDETDNEILDIIIDDDGSFWLVESRGIYHYDGSDFTLYDQSNTSLLSDFISYAEKTPDGTLYFADRSGLFVSYDGVVWEEPNATLAAYGTITGMASDDAGNIWFSSTDGGIIKFDGTSASNLTSEAGLISDHVLDVYCKENEVYALSESGVSIYSDDFSIIGAGEFEGAQRIYVDDNHKIWVCTTRDLWSYTHLEGWVHHDIRFLGENFEFEYDFNTIAQDENGALWIGSRWGLLSYQNGKYQAYNTFDGLPSNEIYAILKDDEGNLIFPSDNHGVSIYDGSSWKWLFYDLSIEAAIWMQNTTAAHVTREGAIWLGGASGVSYKEDLQTWESFRYIGYEGASSKVPVENVNAIAEDINGNIWLGGSSGQNETQGLGRFDGSSWIYLYEEDGLLNESAEHLFGDSKGNMWLGYGINSVDALTVINQELSLTHFSSSDGAPNFEQVWDMAEDAEGNIWVATSDGLGKYDGSEWEKIEEGSGSIISNRLREITIDGDDNIWVSYGDQGNGLSVLSGGVWYHLTSDEGLPTNNITSIQTLITSGGESAGRGSESGSNDIWLGINEDGIARTTTEKLLALATQPPLEVEKVELSALRVFPNPSAEYITIDMGKQIKNYQFEIISLQGQKLYGQSSQTADTKISVPVRHLRSGIYVGSLVIDGARHSFRFVKK
ncbi:two-component regulator propeller domain-containing protein [Ekhidna sp.]|jgi:ligand-binding sensor domain-containing protein|uniref:two-component regulator propeller domain-containing protein n=1 Tax=Ekhidna sp. TaxID=2608089 RepID=UPI0032EE2805